jgi:excisionase family DNA binding protein
MRAISSYTALELSRPNTVPLPTIPGERISYTLQNAANVLDLSVATLRRLEKAGRLRFIRIGGRTLVDAKSLHALTA